jgi:hypothetical protein
MLHSRYALLLIVHFFQELVSRVLERVLQKRVHDLDKVYAEAKGADDFINRKQLFVHSLFKVLMSFGGTNGGATADTEVGRNLGLAGRAEVGLVNGLVSGLSNIHL